MAVLYRDEHAERLFVSVATDVLPMVSTGMEAAELLVALANSDAKKAVVSAAYARKALSALSEGYRKQVEKFWEDAHHEAMELLVLVLENNPKQDRDTLFERPDVQSALRFPYEQAAAKSVALLQQAWGETDELTIKYLKSEFKMIQQEWMGHDADTALLQSLVGDLYTNAAAMRGRYLEAVRDLSKDFAPALSKITKDATRRAGYSLTTMVWGQSSEIRDSAFARAGLNKMWVAKVEDKANPPCSHCKALHGRVIAPGEQFDIDAGKTKLKAYRNRLIGPPRHPWCRCHIVGTKMKKN